MDLTARLDAMEAAIKKPSFRQSSGKANEVNYWIFDYPPEKELEVRERIEYMKNKNLKGTDEYQLVVFDLYDIIIDFLERKNFVEKCCDFEKKRGFGRIVKAVSNSMKVTLRTFSGEQRLNNKEYQLMELFMRNPRQVFSTTLLMDKVWELESEAGTDVVWTYIGFLRRKLRELNADIEIKTIRGAGYTLESLQC